MGSRRDEPHVETADQLPASAGEVRLSVAHDVESTAHGVRQARDAVRSTVLQWDLGAAMTNAILDVAHELVTNAVQHGGEPVVVTVERSPSAVMVNVHDGSRELARTLPYRPGVSERGLGLRLVAQLSRAWGQRSEPDGKTVWAVVEPGLWPSR